MIHCNIAMKNSKDLYESLASLLAVAGKRVVVYLRFCPSDAESG